VSEPITTEVGAVATTAAGFERRLGFTQATAINLLAMIGVGPFLTIPLLLRAMHGPQALVGWIVGAIVAVGDGLVWAELGAAMPRGGGGYQYVLEAFDRRRLGRVMSFLFLWQTVACFPLIIASGAVGFAQYAAFLYPSMTIAQAKGLAMAVCLVAMVLTYRRIDSAGHWGVAFAVVVAVVGAWIVGEGLLNGGLDRVTPPPDAFRLSRGFWLGLGSATLYAMYTYSGYNTICSVGDEVTRPATTIPRSIVWAIAAVALLYVALHVSIVSVMPWSEAMASTHVASELIARLHPGPAASVMTMLILVIALAGLFANMLGASRVPYAAAVDRRFFDVFARLHPTGGFPSFAVAFMGVSSAFCCLLDLDAIITLVIVIWAIVGAFPVVVAATALRVKRPDIHLPFRMWWYPLPILVSLVGWTSIVASGGVTYFAAGLGVLGLGILAYLWRAKQESEWPFA